MGIAETQESEVGSRGELGSGRGEEKETTKLREANWDTEAEKSDEKDQKGN